MDRRRIGNRDQDLGGGERTRTTWRGQGDLAQAHNERVSWATEEEAVTEGEISRDGSGRVRSMEAVVEELGSTDGSEPVSASLP